MSAGGTTPFIVLYRWRLHPGQEETFIETWSLVTRLLRATRGALGSRLHRSTDGLWYAYALWPSAEARDASIALGPVDQQAGAAMRDTIAEMLPEIVLEPVADYLLPLPRPFPVNVNP